MDFFGANILSTLWGIIQVFFWAFVFISALFVVFSVISDLIRDKELNGWAKAIWVIFLIVVPFLTALVYLIFRGRGMAERQALAVARSQQAADEYIRSVAGSSPSDEIVKAKQLLDQGVISADEFAAIKKKALASL